MLELANALIEVPNKIPNVTTCPGNNKLFSSCKSGFAIKNSSTDILLLSVSDQKTDNYRKLTKKYYSVLLIKRDNYPYKDKWCLPGGFINPLNEIKYE